MTPLGTHGLACLDDADPAAVALYLQAEGLAIDAALDGISDSLDTFNMRPTFTGVTTAISGPASTVGESQFPITSWSLGYSNFTTLPVGGSAPGGFRLRVPKTGWFGYGVYANMQATGALTALSRRTLFAKATLQASGTSMLLSQAVWRTVETSTAGGEFLVAGDGSFYATVGQTVDVEGYWSHTNAASTVQVNAGARLWCHFIGSGVEIGSA